MDHARDRAALRHERDRYRPSRVAGDEGAGPVDGIDDQQCGMRQAGGIVSGFLRKPAGFGKRRAQPLFQEPIDGEIR
jgi:hypothetical protein